jgi:hypothetical protein
MFWIFPQFVFLQPFRAPSFRSFWRKGGIARPSIRQSLFIPTVPSRSGCPTNSVLLAPAKTTLIYARKMAKNRLKSVNFELFCPHKLGHFRAQVFLSRIRRLITGHNSLFCRLLSVVELHCHVLTDHDFCCAGTVEKRGRLGDSFFPRISLKRSGFAQRWCKN